MITDRLYHSGAYRALELQSKVYLTYFYYFRAITKTGTDTSNEGPTKPFLGVSHGDDVFLIFNNPNYRGPANIPYSENEKIVGHNLIKMYRSYSVNNFAYYGNIAIRNIYSSVQCLEIFSAQNFSMQAKDESFGQVEFWTSLKIND